MVSATRVTRVDDYTLSFLMVNLWVDSIGAFVIFGIFYCCCRVYRRVKEKFIQKLHKLADVGGDGSDDDDYDNKLKLI